MGGFSPVHWIIVLAILAAVPLVPVLQILRRAGFSGWWSILYFLPVVNWIVLWVFAFARWPSLEPQTPAGSPLSPSAG
jgi:hypothetical protein